jgi:hypothetical protein
MPKISELTDLSSLADADDTVVVDDTDDNTKRAGMDTIATYFSFSNALSSAVQTEGTKTIRQIAQDLGATNGSVLLTIPTINETSFVVYDLTNPDTSGNTIIRVASTSGNDSYFVAIYNNSAYSIDIDRIGFNSLYLPGTGDVASFTLAANEVFFSFVGINDWYGIYKG